MKRHPSLQTLSRDHHEALLQALSLQNAAKGKASQRVQALASFSAAWEELISQHFEEEERLLPPLVKGLAEWKTLFAEHAELRKIVKRVLRLHKSSDPDPELLRRLSTRLHDHIRWEERVLFPKIEKKTSEAFLAALGEKLKILEATRPRNQNRGFCR